MPTVGNEITDLDIRAVPGQGDSITLINLLSLTSTTIDQWTAKAGAGLDLSLTVTASGNDVVVAWSDAQATTIIGRPWRLRLSGKDKFGGRVVESRPVETPGDQTVTVTMADPVEVTVEVSGVAVGAVDSVNGETGVVTLSAADVGADATGTASTAVSSHAAAVDPHGDRAYTDAELAAYKPAIPHIEWAVSQPGGSGTPWRIIIPAPLRSAVYVPSEAVATTPPTGDFDGVEVEAPSNPEVSWSVVLPASAGGALVGVYDPTDHTTTTGFLLLPTSTWTLAASETGWTPVAMVAQHHPTYGNIWIGLAPPDAWNVEVALADKEDAGVAQSLIDGLPDVVAGSGIDLTPVGDTLVVSQQGADVQDFSTVGTATWTKPAGATLIMAYVLGGGGGGGAGRKGAEGTLRHGGCGGQAGSAVVMILPASSVSDTVTVTVGDGGAGAAVQTTNNTNGVSGTIGGSSSFGSYAVALGGFGGVGGADTASTTAAQGTSHWPVGTTGLNGDSGNGFGPPSGGNGHAGGGGAGGYRSAANANSLIVGTGGLGAGNITSPSGSGAGGNAGSTIYGGTGGNGGLASGSGNATSGGAGGVPSGGGGGGGAAVNSVGNSGAGGKGGKGFVRVVTLR